MIIDAQGNVHCQGQCRGIALVISHLEPVNQEKYCYLSYSGHAQVIYFQQGCRTAIRQSTGQGPCNVPVCRHVDGKIYKNEQMSSSPLNKN